MFDGWRSTPVALRGRLARFHRWYWGAVVLTAVVAVWSVWSATSSADRQRDEWGERVAVITARHDVPAGRSITSADVDNVQLPRAAVPPGAVTELVGDAVATHHIGPREVITEADVGIGSTEAAVVGPGRRGLFVPWAPGVPTMSTGTPVELIVLAPIDPLGQASGSPEILGRGVVVAATDQGVLVSVTAQQSADAAAAVASGQLTLAVIGG